VWADRMLAALAMPDAELSIVLCDDRTIHELNRSFRHMDKPTDVLAFAVREAIAAGVPDAALPAGVLGDVVISVPTAARQARVARRSVEDEIAMLLAHGLLHLLGRDHRDRTEERRMTAMTDALRSTTIARGARRRSRADRRKTARTEGRRAN
jgi:probable rRNA maturation factor